MSLVDEVNISTKIFSTVLFQSSSVVYNILSNWISLPFDKNWWFSGENVWFANSAWSIHFWHYLILYEHIASLDQIFLSCFQNIYSGPPLLAREHCSFLFCIIQLANASKKRKKSKQKQISTSDRCCFADLFALL